MQMAEIWLEIVVKRQFVSLLFFVTPSIMISLLDIFRYRSFASQDGQSCNEKHQDCNAQESLAKLQEPIMFRFR